MVREPTTIFIMFFNTPSACGGELHLKNDKGVAVSVKTHAEDLAMSVGVTGVTVQMVDEK